MNTFTNSSYPNLKQAWEIIITEDNEGINHLINKNLTRLGYSCIQAYNGQQVINAVKKDQKQILILDYKLPDNNGEEVIKALQEKNGTAPPFIVLTGFGDENLAVKMMKLGAIDYINKVTDFIDVLGEKLGRICEEQEKNEENVRYQKLLNETERLAGVGGWLWFVKSDKWIMSDNWMALHGCSEKSFTTDLLLQIAHPEDAERITKAFAKTAKNGEPYQMEHKIIRQDNGEERYIKAFGEAELDAKGNVEIVSGAAMDITEEKKAEKKLRESEEKFRSIFDSAAMGIFRSTPEGRYEAVNKAFAQMLGYDSPNQLMEQVTDIRKLYKYPEEREKLLKQLADKEYVENFEVLFNHPNNETVWVSINAKQQQHPDGHIYYEGTIQDITQKKIAEEKLSETEQRLHILADNIPDEIFIKDKQHRFVYVNPTKAKLERITPETMIGKTDFDFFSKPVAQKSYQDDIQILKSGKPIINKEELLINSDGDSRWVLVTKLPRIDKDGKIIGTMGISRDISFRKNAELRLRENEKRLEIRKNIAEAFVLEEKDKIFHPVLHTLLGHFNSRFGFFGYIDQKGDLACPSMTYDIWDECEVKNKSTVFPKEIWTGLWGESLSKQKSLIKNAKLKVPPGHVTLKNAMVGVIEFQGKLIGQLAFANNDKNYTNSDLEELDEICQYISPLLHAELSEEQHTKELIEAKEIAEENERKLIEAQEISHVGSWEYHVDTDTVTWSKELYNIFERSYDLPAPKYTEQAPFYTKESFAKLDKALQDCIRDEIPYEVELDIITSGGAVKQIISKGNAKRDANNKIIGSYGTAQDITPQKKLESELIAAKEKAEESDRLKSAFLANMSHEIRTPMNGILGFTNLLQEPSLTGEQQKDFIDIIQKSGDRMLNTVNDLIDISRIETGQVKVTNEETDICHDIKSLYTFFQPEAQQKGLQFTFENNLQDVDSRIFTDKTKFVSITTNLIKNALKYTIEGSVKIGCQTKEGNFIFYVKDTGIGIPQNRQQAIFNRFEQADIGDSRVFEGSGLGLAITKAYVEMLNGKIWLESEEGVGSTFGFSLPWKNMEPENPVNETPEVAKPHVESGVKPKILIAEDDEVSFFHLSILLEKHAREIIHALNGRQAVQLCKQHPDTDVVLMDMKMPVMDGFEATRKIREFNKDVVIIAQTAYALPGDDKKTIDAGCNDYIAKPIDAGGLLKKIEKHSLKNQKS